MPRSPNNYGVGLPGRAAAVLGPLDLPGLSGKLNYTYGTGSRLALTALRSQFQGRSSPSTRPQLGGSTSIPGSPTRPTSRGFRNWNNILTLNWTQNLTKSAERALALETFFSYQQDRTIAARSTRRASWAAGIRSAGS